MKIKQVVEFFIYDDAGIKLFEDTDSEEFTTITNYAVMTITIPQSTTDQEVIFSIGAVKILYISSDLLIKYRVNDIANQQFNLNKKAILNSEEDITKVYFTNSSTTTDALVKLIMAK